MNAEDGKVRVNSQGTMMIRLWKNKMNMMNETVMGEVDEKKTTLNEKKYKTPKAQSVHRRCYGRENKW